MKWLKDNFIKILFAIVSVTFGYAHFIGNSDAKAHAVNERVEKLEKRADANDEKREYMIKMLERIDERTKKL